MCNHPLVLLVVGDFFVSARQLCQSDPKIPSISKIVLQLPINLSTCPFLHFLTKPKLLLCEESIVLIQEKFPYSEKSNICP